MTRLEAKMTPSRRQSTSADLTRLDLTAASRLESTSNDLRRSEVVMNLHERCMYIAGLTLFVKCFIPSVDVFCNCHFLKKVHPDS